MELDTNFKEGSSKGESFIVLLNPDIIQVAIVNKVDEVKHILMEQKGEGVYIVIKNKENLTKMFRVLEEMISQCGKETQNRNNQQQDQRSNKGLQRQKIDVKIVCYSPKPYTALLQRISSISPLISEQIIYFNIASQKLSSIRPNRAFFQAISLDQKRSINTITYGEGYSQLKPKQELRMAVQSVFAVHQKSKIIFVETQKGKIDQEKSLTKDGYGKVWTLEQICNDKKVEKESFNVVFKQYLRQKMLKNKKNQENISSVESSQHQSQKQLKSSYYLQTLKSQRTTQQFEQLSSKLILSHFVTKKNDLSTSSIINSILYKPKKSLTPTPKSIVPSSKSKQICSYIFKNLGDQKLYLAKASVPKDIGGLYHQEIIENRCFASLLPNLFPQISGVSWVYSLQLEKMSAMMKYCKIKAYQTKKATMIVKRYLQNLQTLDDFQGEFIELLDKKHNVQSCQQLRVKGLGSALFWSIVTDQSFRTKPFLSQLSLIKHKKSNKQLSETLNILQKPSQQISYLTKQFINLRSFISEQQSVLLITDHFEPFSSIRSPLSAKTSIKFTHQHQIQLSELPRASLKEMYFLAKFVAGDRIYQDKQQPKDNEKEKTLAERVIRGFGKYYKWQFDKSEIFDSIIKRAIQLKTVLETFLPRQDIQSMQPLKNINNSFIRSVSEHCPTLLLLLISEDYATFTRPPSQKFSFPSNNQAQQNRYITHFLTRTSCLQIHGTNPPIYQLPLWLRLSGNRFSHIEYLSFIDHSKDDYILMSKKLNLLKTNSADKFTPLLIVDHCELKQQILDEGKNVRTVFVSRFKKGQHEMPCIIESFDLDTDNSNEKKYIQDSSDEIIQLLLQLYEEYVDQPQMDSFNLTSEDKVQSKSVLPKTPPSRYLYQKYLFVFQTYFKVKSCLYSLPLQSNNQSPTESIFAFVLKLHRDIGQNKNRLKELQQRYKANDEWKLLYLLPVKKNNMRIYWQDGLSEWLDVWKVVKEVTEFDNGDKNTKQLPAIDPKCLNSFKQFIPYIQPHIVQSLSQILCSCLIPLAKLPYNQYITNSKSRSHLQTIISFLQALSEKSGSRKPFPQELALYHFPSQTIKKATPLKIVKGGIQAKNQQRNYYLIHTNEKIVVYEVNRDKVYEKNGEYSQVNAWIQYRQAAQNNLNILTLILLLSGSTQKDYNFQAIPIQPTPQSLKFETKEFSLRSYYNLNVLISHSSGQFSIRMLTSPYKKISEQSIHSLPFKIDLNLKIREDQLVLSSKEQKQRQIIDAKVISVKLADQLNNSKKENVLELVILLMTKSRIYEARIELKEEQMKEQLIYSKLLNLSIKQLVTLPSGNQFLSIDQYNATLLSLAQTLTQRSFYTSSILKLQNSKILIIPQETSSDDNKTVIKTISKTQSRQQEYYCSQFTNKNDKNQQLGILILKKTVDRDSGFPGKQQEYSHIKFSRIFVTPDWIASDYNNTNLSSVGVYFHQISVILNQASQSITIKAYYSLIDRSLGLKNDLQPFNILNTKSFSVSIGQFKTSENSSSLNQTQCPMTCNSEYSNDKGILPHLSILPDTYDLSQLFSTFSLYEIFHENNTQTKQSTSYLLTIDDPLRKSFLNEQSSEICAQTIKEQTGQQMIESQSLRQKLKSNISYAKLWQICPNFN